MYFSTAKRQIEWRVWSILYPIIRLIYSAILEFRGRFLDQELKATRPIELRYRLQHDVIHGGDGFLFHRDHDALEQFRGTLVFRPRQIEVWNAALNRRDAWCRANGARTRVLIIPEKHVVYRRFLPRGVKISENRPAPQLMRALDPSIARNVIYPLEEFRIASARRTTFLKTDTHWTSYGAFVAYQALIRSLRSDMDLPMVGEGELTWREAPFVGDLGVRQEPERGERMDVATPPLKYELTFSNRIFDRGALHIFTNERGDLPRCVLFRDSFSNALIPFLMQSFSRVVAVSNLSCLYDLLDAEKPDVVLFAVIERFLATFGRTGSIELPDVDGGVSFQSLTGIDLAQIQNYTKITC
jgi:hypothetical protein